MYFYSEKKLKVWDPRFSEGHQKLTTDYINFQVVLHTASYTLSPYTLLDRVRKVFLGSMIFLPGH